MIPSIRQAFPELSDKKMPVSFKYLYRSFLIPKPVFRAVPLPVLPGVIQEPELDSPLLRMDPVRPLLDIRLKLFRPVACNLPRSPRPRLFFPFPNVVVIDELPGLFGDEGISLLALPKRLLGSFYLSGRDIAGGTNNSE